MIDCTVSKKQQKHNALPVAFILAACTIIILIVLCNYSKMLIWDEAVYLSNARSHISSSRILEDFRYPLLEWMVAGLWSFTGQNLFAAQLLMMVFAGITVGLFYLICRKNWSTSYSIFLSIIFMTSPLLLYWGFRIYTDVPSLFFIVLSYYLLQSIAFSAESSGISNNYNIQGQKDKNNSNNINKNIRIARILGILAGASAGLAFLTKFTLALFPLAVAIFLIGKKRWKTLALFALGFAIIILPWAVYNQITYHDPLWDIHAQYAAVERWNTLEPWQQQVRNLLTKTNIIILIACIATIIYALIGLIKIIVMHCTRKEHSHNNDISNKTSRTSDLISRSEVWILIIYIVLCFIYYICIAKLKDARYIISFLPFITLLGGWGLYTLFGFGQMNKKNVKHKPKNMVLSVTMYISIILVVISSIILLFPLGEQIVHEYQCTLHSPILTSIEYLRPAAYAAQGTVMHDPQEFILSNAWVWYEYYLNVRSRSTWDSNITYLINIHHPMYIVYDTYFNPLPASEFKKDILIEEKRFNNTCNSEEVIVYRVRNDAPYP